MRYVAALLLSLLLTAPTAVAQISPNATQLPVRIAIPTLGIEAPIVPVGLEEDGAMAAPADPDTVGWYEFGPGIGGAGNAILAGHVDWGGSLRVFGLLRWLEPGDEIVVSDADGAGLTYRVVWSHMVDAESSAVDEIFAQGPAEELTLITCGGTFDRASHQYLSRLVVRAVREQVDAIF
jgi:LPXTG-site transpeptidase (sortase) family protein